MNKIAIYTCITGGYDTPSDNFNHKDDYDYILFSDEIIATKSWKNNLIYCNKNSNLSNVKIQRFVKTHPYSLLDNYDIVVWVDANTDINDKLYDYIESNKDNLITFKTHPDRNCIYEEINICVTTHRESKEIGDKVKDKLVSEKYPQHNGLYETNIIISHPQNQRVRELFSKWWDEILENSHRDQLSLNYVIWKNNLEDIICSTNTKDFKPKVHIKQKK